MERVLDPRLFLLHLGLGCGADIDHGHSADDLGQPLLELFLVVIRGGLFDLGLDLLDPALDLGRVSRAFDDRGVVLVNADLLRPAEVGDLDVLELEPEVLGDHLPAGKDRQIFEHGLAPVAETRGLHRADLERAAELVHDQGCERLALNVLGEDEERLVHLCGLLEDGEQVLHARYLFLREEDVGVIQYRLHLLGVRNEIGRNITPVELHAFHHIQAGCHALGLFHGDHAVLADLVDRLGDEIADGGVAVR